MRSQERPIRILVLGASGSGKTTLGGQIAEHLDLPFVRTDPIFWTDDWRPTPRDEVRRWLVKTAARDAWVLDGNFDGDRELIWGRAQLAVWLDLPASLTLARVARRNLGWWLARRRVWGGGRMTLAKALGGVRHTARTHGAKRGDYPAMLAEFSELEVVRLSSPAAVRAWLADLD